MKPARSPRFRSAALRRSIAATSFSGSPSGSRGAAQAAIARATYHAPCTRHLAWSRSRHNVASVMSDATLGAKTCRGSASRRWLEPSGGRSRGATSTSASALAAAALLPRFLALAAAPGLGPGLLRLLLLGAALRLRPRGLSLLLACPLGLRRPHRLRHHGGGRGGRRIHRLHHSGAGPAALRGFSKLEHRISPPLVVRRRGL